MLLAEDGDRTATVMQDTGNRAQLLGTLLGFSFSSVVSFDFSRFIPLLVFTTSCHEDGYVG
jgi:hypothetical protein